MPDLCKQPEKKPVYFVTDQKNQKHFANHVFRTLFGQMFITSALASRSKRLVQILDQQSTGLLAETLEARNGAAHA